MAQSLSLVLLHIIFSTKDRQPWLTDTLQPTMFAYLAGVVRKMDCECYRVGGFVDHVHLAINLPRTKTQAQIVEEIKTASSKWVKTQSPELTNFAWQRGYGVFSVSHKNLATLCHYIDKQKQHHQTHTFQEEYLNFLQKYGISHNESYLWD